ncbi:gluconokinase [Roseibium algae]|uniref:Gluconokinase n=1 Tax=Roseibium algae TaxID=3123038 RepID=A0ABU8TJE1_9HYPH
MKRMVIIMGVAGCGKTTVGEHLSEALDWRFLDGDSLHPADNIEKMSKGTPLTDEDRWPWLGAVGSALQGSETSIIIGCSSLKRIYRDEIRKTAQGPVSFVHLAGSKELIALRMQERAGHFMPLSLLESQFAALETPGNDENTVTVDIAKPLNEAIADLVNHFGKEEK